MINQNFRDHPRDVAMVTVFWRKSAKIDIPHLHSVYWHSTTDGRTATWMHAFTQPMIPLRLVTFFLNSGPVIPEFCAGWSTR